MSSAENPTEPVVLDALISFLEVHQSGRCSYSDQVWNRFNWFLTLQLAAIGFYFTQWEMIGANTFFQHAIPVIGGMGALIWALMGWEDLVSLRRHNGAYSELENQVASIFREYDIELPAPRSKSNLRFRQNWLLIVYPLFLFATWIVLKI